MGDNIKRRKDLQTLDANEGDTKRGKKEIEKEE